MKTPIRPSRNYKEIEQLLLICFVSQGSGASLITLDNVGQLVARFYPHVVSWEVEADDNGELLEEFRISQVPTLVILRKGDVLERFSGLFPKSKLEAVLCRLLEGSLVDPCTSN